MSSAVACGLTYALALFERHALEEDLRDFFTTEASTRYLTTAR